MSKITIELTERCNNNCIHCCINLPANDKEARNRELTAEEIKKVLIEAASLGCRSVKFTGGEPLLRDDIVELCLFAKRLKLIVEVATNATLLSDHRLAALFVERAIDFLFVTLYGMKEETYEAVTRTAGSFFAARRGLQLIMRSKIPFMVNSVLLPENRSELIEYKSWAATLPLTKGEQFALPIMLLHCRARRDSEAKNEFIKSLRISPDEALSIMAEDKDAFVSALREYCSRSIQDSGDKLFRCGAGVGTACLDAYGNYQLCLLLRHQDTVYPLGRGSLKDAVDVFFQQVRELTPENPEYIERCHRCFLRGLLCDQCPAKSWMENGTLDSPVEYLCKIAHCKARLIGILNHGESAWNIKNGKRRMVRFIA